MHGFGFCLAQKSHLYGRAACRNSRAKRRLLWAYRCTCFCVACTPKAALHWPFSCGPAFTAAPRHIHAPLFACRACTHPVFAAHVASLHLLLMYCLTNFLPHPTTNNRMQDTRHGGRRAGARSALAALAPRASPRPAPPVPPRCPRGSFCTKTTGFTSKIRVLCPSYECGGSTCGARTCASAFCEVRPCTKRACGEHSWVPPGVAVSGVHCHLSRKM